MHNLTGMLPVVLVWHHWQGQQLQWHLLHVCFRPVADLVQAEEYPSHPSVYGEWCAASAALALPAVLLYHPRCHMPSHLDHGM